MPDQLSLKLDAALPRLPATLRPMLAIPGSDPFDSPDHLFEPVWGGVRALAFLERGDLLAPEIPRILDVHGRDLAPFLPELQGLRQRFTADAAIVDGELVVVDRSGRCDALALADRLRGGPGPPVAYLVFDLLHLDGRPLLNQPLGRRRATLQRVLRSGEEVIAVPAIAGEGRALHEAAVAAGLPGVMARVIRSPYLPGVRSRLWRYIHRDRAERPELEPAPGSDDVGAPDEPRSSPVLALIRRLPLDDSDQ